MLFDLRHLHSDHNDETDGKMPSLCNTEQIDYINEVLMRDDNVIASSCLDMLQEALRTMCADGTKMEML